MASNFYIVAKKKRNQFLELRLFGDFDASSACELINYLDESVNTSCKVIIDTDGLRAIDGFGLSLFRPQLSKRNKLLADIEVVGRFGEVFREE
ncbi:hypothetical protein JCM12296A_53840 [Desulfosarcina cetonica]|uniref:STAS domain-containing protein n=1 Tax=Desulfosarcina cetonica TaxID=90730 RepID=UPI0006CFF516|nr:STAS domain-containing protein [Desulfosarcina cetonica]